MGRDERGDRVELEEGFVVNGGVLGVVGEWLAEWIGSGEGCVSEPCDVRWGWMVINDTRLALQRMAKGGLEGCTGKIWGEEIGRAHV